MLKKFFSVYFKYFLIILTSAAIVVGLVFLIKFYNTNFNYNMTIVARFSQLGPIYKNMPVYYKGYKIGKVKKIRPSDDYEYSLMSIVLYPKNIALPENTTAKVQKMELKRNYIDLVYPKEPAEQMLKNGSIIEGHTAMDLESFIQAQAESGQLGAVTENASAALSNLGDAAVSMGELFDQLSSLVAENRPNIKRTTESTAQAAENLNKMTAQLQKSMSQEKLSSSVSNLEKSTKNVEQATENLKNITGNIDKATKKIEKTMEKVDCAITEARHTATNAKCITRGVSELLNKRFAGMRIMFGKPIDSSCGCAAPCEK